MKKIIFGLAMSCLILITSCSQPEQSQDKETNKITEKSDSNSGEKEISVEETLLEQGKVITKALKATIQKNMLDVIRTEGISDAITSCNMHALPITDSISDKYGVDISRITHLPRNPLNKANKSQLAVIKYYQDQLDKHEKMLPMIKTSEETFDYYSPIKITSAVCLNCHGNPKKHMSEETFIVLNLVYPNDSALGFEMGDLRGIWEIKFPKSNYLP